MSERFKQICVMGLGYIGLPTASLLGTKGYDVRGVDVCKNIIETINDGRIHIVEPDLDILVKSAVQSGKLKADSEPCEADVFVIAVPTPFKNGKTPDMSYVAEATKKISPYIKPGNLVILESTSPVGTTDEVVAQILSNDGHNIGSEVYVAHCPERVLPGRILIELIENDRVVGGVNEASTKAAVEFYTDFVRGDVLATTAKTAEMVKLSENALPTNCP
jgi:UDP-N-acetyl-D-mannosaminuronic acid dehydrogenase